MRIMITGSRGQLGSALHTLRPEACGLAHADLEITDRKAVFEVCERVRPELIVHCAAWTAVDEAARQPQLAYRVNALGTHNLVLAALKHDAVFAYISTNEVFDGVKAIPYLEYDSPNPINAYGRSKWAGEKIVAQHLRRFFIIRTSWLTGQKGRNFVHRVVELADEKGKLRVVTDEVASPTFVDDLAPAIWQLVDTAHYGIYHLASDGICSRYELACAILALVNREHVPVDAITLKEFNRPSSPPCFSALGNVAAAELGITLPRWDAALARFLEAHPTVGQPESVCAS
jgi:dTDP-4-dehydrorhamnose reductase